MRALALSLLMVAMTAMQFPQASPPSPKESRKQFCKLAGLVLADPGSKPVRKADVRLISHSDDELSFETTTNAEGRFSIAEIPPGTYRFSVEHSAFVDPHVMGRRLTMEAGRDMSDFVWHVVAAAAIQGRVIDEDGDPVKDAVAGIFRGSVDPRKQTTLYPIDETLARSNDRGEFRIAGLRPGRYYVMAQPRLQAGFAPKALHSPDEKTSYVTTYYPNALDWRQALPLELRPGDEAPVSIVMQRMKTFAVRGSAAPSSTANSFLDRVKLVEENLTFQLTSRVGSNGRFEFKGVPPGSYLLTQDSYGGALEYALESIVVTNRDVENVQIRPVHLGDIRGKIRVEGESKADFSQFEVALEDASNENLASHTELLVRSPGNAPIAKDGSFLFPYALPASYYFTLKGGSEHGYFLKSVVVGTESVTDTPMKISEGDHLSVVLVISPTNASIEGVVVDAKDKPVADATVAAVPEAKYRPREGHWETLTDQNGRFRFDGLTPGEYTLLAAEDLGFDSFDDPEVFAKYEPSGTIVRLSANSHEGMKLKAIAAPSE